MGAPRAQRVVGHALAERLVDLEELERAALAEIEVGEAPAQVRDTHHRGVLAVELAVVAHGDAENLDEERHRAVEVGAGQAEVVEAGDPHARWVGTTSRASRSSRVSARRIT